MFYSYCWHRPGSKIINEIYRCRHCGVAIEECIGVQFRQACIGGNTSISRAPCQSCEGSGWVGIVRSKRAELSQMLDLAHETTTGAGRSQ